MLDNMNPKGHDGAVDEIPMDFIEAVQELPVSELLSIEKEIAYYEATGILTGRALTVMKSLQAKKPRRKSQRPQMLAI